MSRHKDQDSVPGSGAALGNGFQEEPQAYGSGARQAKPLGNASLEILTDDCSRTVKAAIDEHRDAGRPVYTQDSSGRIAKLSRTPQ